MPTVPHTAPTLSSLLRLILLPALWSAASLPACAVPHVPSADSVVVERLPARATDPRMRELIELRAAWRRDPADADVAVRLAQAYFDQAAAEGDPRYIGHAQAAIGRWWDQPDPPLSVRVMRAILLQYGHRFAEAVADLDAAVVQQPGLGEAWAWLAGIHMVQADYTQARRACTALAPLAPPLIATGCVAYVDSVTGRAGPAAEALRTALRAGGGASAAQRQWALTRLAEIEEHRGAIAPAEAAYREALGLDRTDVYLLAAYADFLLDQNRAPEVLVLLKDRARADVLLLRLALAAKQAKDPAQAGWTADLAARFAAAQARGDTTHQKEEARFALGMQGQAERALALAQANYALQREVADARILLEAALAARQPAAAAPVLQWMAASGVEGVTLQALAARIKALR